MCVYIARSYIG